MTGRPETAGRVTGLLAGAVLGQVRLRRVRARRMALHEANEWGLVRLRLQKAEGFTFGRDGRQRSNGENCGVLQAVGARESAIRGILRRCFQADPAEERRRGLLG